MTDSGILKGAFLPDGEEGGGDFSFPGTGIYLTDKDVLQINNKTNSLV